VPAEPGHLAFGELARAHFDQRESGFKGTIAAQIFHHLPITEGLHGGWIFSQPQGQESFGFGYQAAPKHFIDARLDAGVQVCAGSDQAEKEFRSAFRT